VKVSTRFVLPLMALFFWLLLVPRASAAGIADCPIEPKSGVAIASGDIYAGANCTLKSTTDVDSFVFGANSGDVWHFLVSGNNEAQFGIDICLTVYNPSASSIFSQCSDTNAKDFAVIKDLTLTATGVFTIVVSELTSGTLNYGLSLERLYTTPPDGQKIGLSQSLTGSLSPGEDSPAYAFLGATTGTYRASATIPKAVQFQNNLCMNVYSSLGASVGTGCTDTNAQGYTINIDFTPTQAGTYLALVYEAGFEGSGSVNYSLEVSCLVGTCTQFPPPPCTLKDTATYNATTSTLTMNFTVGNTAAETWNAWLTYQNTMVNLFSTAQPITNPPKVVVKTKTALAKEGIVGVLSTLTTPTGGITCQSWVLVNTGKP